jgi:tetratricopeptide (TPR) repeat protein
MKAGWLKLFAKELAGKWQIPTFTVAVLLGGVAVYVLIAHQKQTTTAEYIQICGKLLENRHYDKTSQLATALLKDPQLTAPQKAELYGILARVIHHAESERSTHSPEQLKTFHQYLDLATKGRKLTGEENRLLVDVYRWENQFGPAAGCLRVVLESNPPDRISYLKQLIKLLPRTGKNVQEEYSQRLDELLAQTNLNEDDLVWGLDLKTEMLFKEGQFDRAVGILTRTLPRVKEVKNQLQVKYSQALGLYYQGQNDEAEPTVRDILDHLTDREDLDAKANLLMGLICLKGQRPEEATAFFEEVIDKHPETEYHLAALVGKSEAGVALHRFSSAQLTYQEAFGLLEKIGPNKLMTRAGILSSLDRVSTHLTADNDLKQGLVFAHLQYHYLESDDDRGRQGLLARIALWHRQKAETLVRRVETVVLPELVGKMKGEIRENYLNAADFYLKLSQMPGIPGRTSSQVLWQAALCYEKGQSPERSREAFETFVKNWPMDPYLPEALFRLARIYQDQGQFDQAEEYYRRLIHEFTRTPFGQQALIPLAECYLARGPKSYNEAENILRDMVDDTSNQQQFKPDSEEFRSAMFLLGKLYYYKKEYERCVGRLEEALERYPQDADGAEARFLIAQSYRKIADQTQEKIGKTFDKQLKAVLLRSRRDNLQRAGELYWHAIPVFEGISHRRKLEETYLQLAYMYSADCMYDLSRYDQAIKGYEMVIEKYERTPMALDSYVQIANCYQIIGQWGKIKAVLERMKWLLKQMPDQVLAKPGEPFSREDWERWIEWNYQSGLLKDKSPDYLARSPENSVSN